MSVLTPPFLATPAKSSKTELTCLLRRLLLLAFVFALELVAVSTWFDTAALTGSRGLTEAVGDSGPWITRGLVAFSLMYVVLSYLRERTVLEEISQQLSETVVEWKFFVAHGAAMATSMGLAYALLWAKSPGFRTDCIAAGGLLAGMAALLLGIFAAVPPSLCARWVRGSRNAWVYAGSMAVIACLAVAFAELLTERWTNLTFHLVKTILGPFVSDVTADASTRVIATNAFAVTIARQCSGIEGAALMVVFSSLWLWYFRREFSFPNSLLLIPTGVAIMWLLNGFRIAALILIGNFGAPRIALGGFHSQAGWIVFNSVALGSMLGARRIRWFEADTGVKAQADDWRANQAVPYLMPFLGILAAAMISRAATGAGLEWLYPCRFVAAAAVLYVFRSNYRNLDWRFGPVGLALGAVVFVIWMVLEPHNAGSSGKALQANLKSLPSSLSIGWLLIRTLAAVVTVPVAEELAFRGFLIRRMISVDFETLSARSFTFLSVVGSSVAFGLMHGERWLAGTIAGLIYAIAFLRRGRIGDAVAAHAATNALIAFQVLAGGQWGLW